MKSRYINYKTVSVTLMVIVCIVFAAYTAMHANHILSSNDSNDSIAAEDDSFLGSPPLSLSAKASEHATATFIESGKLLWMESFHKSWQKTLPIYNVDYTDSMLLIETKGINSDVSCSIIVGPRIVSEEESHGKDATTACVYTYDLLVRTEDFVRQEPVNPYK